jgi:L-2-hydroxycarboxylate dehydrogenase (NAD+)
MPNRYPVSSLQGFIESAIGHFGVPTDHAQITAARMLDADLRGMRGHGIFRLPGYVKRLESGGYNVTPSIKV